MKTSSDISFNTNGWGLVSVRSISLSLTVALAFLVSGCWAPGIKPPISDISKLNTILVVPVESPPLEITPDPIEDRIPAYGHYRNMAIDFPVEQKLYKTSGDVVVAGLVIRSDDADQVSIQDKLVRPSLASGSGSEQTWTPTLVLARQALTKLTEHNIKASLSGDYSYLPMDDADRDAQLSHWHDATLAWYGQNTATVDDQAYAGIDAVLELGLGSYRIFAGQMSVQVLMKLVDPHTGQVLARTRVKAFTTENVGETSLNRDSEAFKQRLAQISSQLLKQGFHEFGWQL
ncbi:MAG: hypothetical protein M0R33_06255 [Methylomonas sp.]|jgi:hypothetical protein|uniref:hypothetical protein n=1 Tax=Methylomonas sp. TaxID=418 RepID=UPI0025FB1FD2|nr:hypothetical protein [Methylomonas sp.]MCK9606039.1 hypothetical protein [Methylomonas sp.]